MWFDPHPTPGLASFTAVLPDAQVAEICDLVEKRAYDLKRSDTSEDAADKLLGEYRADALYEIVTRNLNYILDIQILTPTAYQGCSNNSADANRNGDSGRDRGKEDSGDDGDDGRLGGNPGGNPGGGGNGPGGTGGDTPDPSKGRSSKKTVTRGEALGLFTSTSSDTNRDTGALGIHHRA
ncbi:hypothetical protein EU513_15570, partial [Yimella sp. RIT 621]|uniref:hypothetical protein n=1 Tax=Yimella sp. RIT 621 TaxID=2510323 RepID=UPI0010DDBCAC